MIGIIGTFGNVYRYQESDHFGVSSAVGVIRPDQSRLLPEFLYHLTTTDKFRAAHEAAKGGSVQGYTNIPTIESLPICLPPLRIQRRIADILGTLDEKIELNRQMNQTLEEMAQALYKHWFVDFGLFQDGEFVDSELGPIPEGWETRKVKEFGKVVLGKTPPTKNEENYGSRYPFIKIPDMHGKVFVAETESYLSEKGGESQHKKFLPPGTISVSCIATPGLVTITSRTAQSNQQINSVIPKDEKWREYLYLTFMSERRRIKRLASGGTATSILNKTDFSNVELLSPPSSVIENFHSTCSDWFNLIRSNVFENRVLVETRDYLLPKLISGEIEVAAAEEQLEAVA